MRIRCPIPLPSCLAAVALFLGGCSGEPTTPVADPVPEGAMRISVRDNFFSPSPQTVNAGQSIVWVWTGSNQHTVQFENLAISSGSAKASGSFEATLSASGSFTYYCEVHGKSVMSGTITVSGAGSGSGGTNTGGGAIQALAVIQALAEAIRSRRSVSALANPTTPSLPPAVNKFKL